MDKRWPEELKSLLRSCWHAEAEERPDAAQAVEALSRVIEKMDATAAGAAAAAASARRNGPDNLFGESA